jgi:predicted nucleic acid-binding protein
VRVFLDTSVLLAACGSDRGASREVFRRASESGWILLASPYVVEEVLANLSNISAEATTNWARLRPDLTLMDDVLTLDQAAVFEPAKDRPILFTALAWSDVLLTLDRNDFGGLLGRTFYGLSVLTPGMFLERERAAGRLLES